MVILGIRLNFHFTYDNLMTYDRCQTFQLALKAIQMVRSIGWTLVHHLNRRDLFNLGLDSLLCLVLLNKKTPF